MGNIGYQSDGREVGESKKCGPSLTRRWRRGKWCQWRSDRRAWPATCRPPRCPLWPGRRRRSDGSLRGSWSSPCPSTSTAVAALLDPAGPSTLASCQSRSTWFDSLASLVSLAGAGIHLTKHISSSSMQFLNQLNPSFIPTWLQTQSNLIQTQILIQPNLSSNPNSIQLDPIHWANPIQIPDTNNSNWK